eukprot:Skav233168  [mRNA]  locus=scaffold7441:7736:9124:+ [translate_table: standard]
MQALRILKRVSKYLIVVTYASVSVMGVSLGFFGLPAKEPQDPSLKEGCSTSWLIFMGMIYALVYFTTDQYVPALPQMERDLGGSQSLMSGTVQMNLLVKAFFGLLASGISDRIGRRPVLLVATFLLSMASFCCACATDIKWFILARVLQGMGESIEPVVFAMARDHFSDPRDRVRIIAALQMIAFIGISVAPFFGGLFAHYVGWRSSFFFLALVWLFMGLYAKANMKECCPDGPCTSYLDDVKRILGLHPLSLLLSESFVLGAYFSFNANSSYLVEVHFGKSVLMSSMIMLGFGVFCGFGAWAADQLQLGVLLMARLTLSSLATTGIVSIFMALSFPNHLWGYLVGTFVQASFMVPSVVSMNVLLFEPLEDCAGMAASFEILAQSVLPSLLSALATQSMISFNAVVGITMWQGGCCMAAGAVFWLGYGCNPPKWAMQPLHEEQAERGGAAQILSQSEHKDTS